MYELFFEKEGKKKSLSLKKNHFYFVYRNNIKTNKPFLILKINNTKALPICINR